LKQQTDELYRRRSVVASSSSFFFPFLLLPAVSLSFLRRLLLKMMRVKASRSATKEPPLQ
jgi:hypothetical protein